MADPGVQGQLPVRRTIDPPGRVERYPLSRTMSQTAIREFGSMSWVGGRRVTIKAPLFGVLPDGRKHLLALELCAGESFAA